MFAFLRRAGVRLLDFKKFVLATSERVKAASLADAREHGRPIRPVFSSLTSKEDFARSLLAENPVDEGLICVLTSLEPCMSFEYHLSQDHKERGLKLRPRKCQHLYKYFIHPRFGFMSARLQTWFPFNIQICLNGREWLSRQLSRKGSGFKRADNVATYNSRFHEGRAVLGTIAGKMSKSGTLGYLGSYKVPEVVLGVNSFILAAQKQNPAATLKLVFIDSWFDPPKEAAATETLINLGCDFVTTHTDSPAPLQILEQKGLFGFGQGADMSSFAPTAHLTAIEDIWGPYYIERTQAILDGTWASADSWEGIKEGTVVISPYNAAVPADVVALADEVQAGYKAGTYDIFTGPIYDTEGVERVPAGTVMTLGELATIDWFVKGVESAA